MILISCEEIDFTLDPDKTVGYDFSVEDNETFSTDDGIMLKNTAALYRMHSTSAVEEIRENSFVKNLVQFEHNPDHLHNIGDESVYCFDLIKKKIRNDELLFQENIENLKQLPEKYDYYNYHYKSITFKNEKVKYGLALINKWLDFNDIIINDDTNPKDISKIIYAHSFDNDEYHSKLSYLNNKLNFLVSVLKNESLTIPFIEAIELNKKFSGNKFINNLPLNPYIGKHIYDMVVASSFKSIPQHYRFSTLIKSAMRMTSFSRTLIGIGYFADDKNIVSSEPKRHTLLRGIDVDTFTEIAPAFRKGLVDKLNVVPRSGKLERTMAMALSPIEISEHDCKSENYFPILIKDLKHVNSLINRYFLNEETNMVELTTIDFLKNNIGKVLKFRSPITCKSKNYKICSTCFGEYKTSKYIGVTAGLFITEKLTQMAMSSFHTSGSATLNTNKDLIKYLNDNLIDINNDNLITLKFKQPINKNDYDLFINIPGFNKIELDKVYYSPVYNVLNEDVGKSIKLISKYLNKEEYPNITPIEQVHSEFLGEMLSVKNLYSSFIEIILCNLFVNKENIIYRYCDINNNQIYKRYGITIVHGLISKILSLLFTPNKGTIEKFYEEYKDILSKDDIKDEEHLNIYEKFWLNKLS